MKVLIVLLSSFQKHMFKICTGALSLTHEAFHSTVAHTVIGTLECVESETALTDCS